MGPLIHLRFGGGAELLFNGIKEWEVELPDLKTFVPGTTRIYWSMKDFILWIKENILRERPKLFMQNGTVRPGILVLINDEDWELVGELEYSLSSNDTVTFISTLHGG